MPLPPAHCQWNLYFPSRERLCLWKWESTWWHALTIITMVPVLMSLLFFIKYLITPTGRGGTGIDLWDGGSPANATHGKWTRKEEMSWIWTLRCVRERLNSGEEREFSEKSQQRAPVHLLAAHILHLSNIDRPGMRKEGASHIWTTHHITSISMYIHGFNR